MTSNPIDELRARLEGLSGPERTEVVRELRAMLNALPEEPTSAADARQRDLIGVFLLGYDVGAAETP